MEFHSSVGKRTRAQTDRYIENRYREMKRDVGESITPRRVRNESKKSSTKNNEEDCVDEFSRKRRRMTSRGSVSKRSNVPDFIMLDPQDQNRVVTEEVIRSDEPGPSSANPRRKSKSVFFDGEVERILIGKDSDESEDDVVVPSPITVEDDDDGDLFARGWNNTKSQSRKPGETSNKSKGCTEKKSWDLDSEENYDRSDSPETKFFRDLGKIVKKSAAVVEPRSGLKTRMQSELDDEDDDQEARVSDNNGFEEEIINVDPSSESHVSSSSSSGSDYDDSQDEDFKIDVSESNESLVKSSSDEEGFEHEDNDLIVESPPSKTSEKGHEKALENEDHNHCDFEAKGSENGSVHAEISVVVPKTTTTEMGKDEVGEKVLSCDHGENIEDGVQYCASNGAGVGDKTVIFEEEVESRKLDDKKEGSKVDDKTPDDEDDEIHEYGENVSVGSVTGQMKAVTPETPSSPIKIPIAESVVKGKMVNENVASDDKGGHTFPLEIKAVGMKLRERKRGNSDAGKAFCRTSQAGKGATFSGGVAPGKIEVCMKSRQSKKGNFDAKKRSRQLVSSVVSAKFSVFEDKDHETEKEYFDAKKLESSDECELKEVLEKREASAKFDVFEGKDFETKKGNFDAKKLESSGACEPKTIFEKTEGGADFAVFEEKDFEKKTIVKAPCEIKAGMKSPKLLESSDGLEFVLKAIFEKGKESVKTSPADEPTLLLKFFYGIDDPLPIEKTDYQLELENIYAELDIFIQYEDIGSFLPPDEVEDEEYDDFTNENFCSKGRHIFFLDEEIGMRCKLCSYVEVEIKYHVQSIVSKYISGLSGKKIPLDEDGEEEDFHILQGLQFPHSLRESGNISNRTEGTVWDIIPGIRNTMYEHQQEGFEFLWKNLKGTLNLNELKISDSKDDGGCIISHAPGTGKTRLTIVFLQSYLELFPASRPVIIAPANMLLTWEEEFRKWNLGVPFLNLNNLLEPNGKLGRNADSLRTIKLKQWTTEKSILGISYSLFEKFVGDKNPKSDKDNKMEKKVSAALRIILLELPRVIVLDEGHTPRNQRSKLWKAITKVDTKRRIILSGTPFQNNFGELYNILCLVRPDFPDQIPSRLKKFCQTKKRQKRGGCGGEDEKTLKQVCIDKNADMDIEELKGMMAPFVHIHKGSILKKSLPGLKDCVVVLNPVTELQKRVVNNMQCNANTFEVEHVLALSTVHPSLLLHIPHSEDLDEELKNIRLDPNEGSKTRFLMELVRLSVAMNEKVLIFSQYIDPLNLIKDQLASIFKWTEGKEMLQMQGGLDQGHRQTLINIFNDPNSESRVLLASTKACSEGISLVGASRVVLLDVVWNPSVERQAISRAYRLGQKKVVYTYHLIMSGTAEWDKYCKQAEKDRLSELVFSEGDKENEKQKASLELSEDRVLDQMISHVKLKDMFERIIYQPKELKLIETYT